ncbi:acyl CoA:acetate/3-ketoacid CoA transferase [Alphaproteobacteria bacterium]|nr:acyl CoA:acetate/3-ketoacid CoA transferase [Alphaproteobacteria bacterium]
MSKNKVITADEAARLIKNGDAIATSGFVGMGHPREIDVAIEKRFLETGEPKNLTLVMGASQAHPGANTGLNRLVKEGLLARVIAGHLNLQKDMANLINENKVEAWNLPQGVIMHLLRAIGGNKPGVITQVGLGTFVDPRDLGGKLNSRTTEDRVEVVTLGGEEYLWYKPLKINVGVIRGTYADQKGNLSWEHEAIKLEQLAVALAAKASGGIVIAQVEKVAENRSFHPKDIFVPGVLVDYVVPVTEARHNAQSYAAQYEPWLTGDMRLPMEQVPPLKLSERKVICRRAGMELVPDAVINLGIGMPEEVASIFAEEGLVDEATSTVEPGPIGGMPQSGLRFGTTINPEAFLEHPSMFDFYDGGGLDLAVLGMAELDASGNVNVSKFGPRIAGAGGFINITQSSKNVVFIGTFTASGLECKVGDGKLQIVKEGKVRKMIEKVEHVTFSGEFARKRGMRVLYVTERAVFTMGEKGLTLIEIAPGIDLEKDVLAQMSFKPNIAPNLKTMDARLFRVEPMNIRPEILAKAKA